MLPTPPPLAHNELPGTGGAIGASPEDFLVSEIPAYEFEGEGPHLYLRVRKRGLNTRQVAGAIATAFSVRERDVGFAGMKDRNAITEQWFSLPQNGASVPEAEAIELGEDMTVLATTRHRNKLRTGHLKGNRFTLTLVGADDVGNAAEIADRVASRGIYNGFGTQRFGRELSNLDEAIEWATSGRRTSRFKARLLPSVLQSHVFNEYLRRRSEEHPAGTVLVGDVLRLDGSNSVFVSEDASEDQPRLDSGDVHTTGPMFGPKCRAASGVPAELEASSVDTLQLDESALHRVGKGAVGTRRDIMLVPEEVAVEPLGEDRFQLSFVLPAGGYATLVAREFTRRSWADGQRMAEDDE